MKRLFLVLLLAASAQATPLTEADLLSQLTLWGYVPLGTPLLSSESVTRSGDLAPGLRVTFLSRDGTFLWEAIAFGYGDPLGILGPAGPPPSLDDPEEPEPTFVPEPGGFLMLLAAALPLWLAKSRRRR